MNPLPVSRQFRLALAVLALAVPAGCSKKEGGSSERGAAAPAASPAPKDAENTTPAPANTSAHKAGSAAAAAPANRDTLFVRAGPFASTRRLVDFLGTLQLGDTTLQLTLPSDETWSVRQPIGDIALPDLPRMTFTPWLHLEIPQGGMLVPFSALKSATLTPHSVHKGKALARLILEDGTELTGTVSGALGGMTEFGRIEVPWRALKGLEVLTREKAAPAEALPLPTGGAATLQDGSRREFNSWAAIVGDVVTNILLAEAGTGPEPLPMPKAGTMEFAGSDPHMFFFQHGVILRGSSPDSQQRVIALTGVVLQQSNGCLLFLSAGSLQGLTWQ